MTMKAAKGKMIILPVVHEHVTNWAECRRCSLGAMAKLHVFGRGTVPCDVLMIGEGPGKSEDVIGEPFVGKAGRVLDALIRDSFPPEITWAITNIVACRPTDCIGGANRMPTEHEAEHCRPRLLEFINRIAKPRALIFLGKVAREFFPFDDLPELPRTFIYHPAYVARQGGETSETYQRVKNDMKTFLKGSSEWH